MHKHAALALGPKCIRGEAALAGLQARASAPIPHGYYPEIAIFCLVLYVPKASLTALIQ